MLAEVLDQPLNRRPYPLAADHGTLVYATWERGRDGNRPTVWRVRAGGVPSKMALLPACEEETLTMSADGRRFACAERTSTSDLFLLEQFSRYRQ